MKTAASKVPRIEPQAQDADSRDGQFIPGAALPMIDQIAWIAKGQCEENLLLKLMGLMNQRAFKLKNQKRPYTGCTELLSAESLAGDEDEHPWGLSSVQHA